MSAPADRSPPWEEGGSSTIVRHPSSPSSGTSAGRLVDDLIVEILSRVPAKSLCRFKCVSMHWLTLTNDRDHRRKPPQTLAGILYGWTSRAGFQEESFVHFTSDMGTCRPLICASLAFLPNHRSVILLDGCNGLVLVLGCSSPQGLEIYYAVCNPATEKWVALPDPNQAIEEDIIHFGLSFDRAVSSHFHVFALLKKKVDRAVDPYFCGVKIYSSETGRWVHKGNGWNGDVLFSNHHLASVFHNGYMHFHALDRKWHRCLAVVDTKGETWTHLGVPGGLNEGFIQQSQGCLHYANFKRDEDGVVTRLVVYVLKDYGSKEWALKHSVEISNLFTGSLYINLNFQWVMIHPDCNLIFFTVGQGIRCYNMDRQQVKLIAGTEYCLAPYFPYVPLYSELPSLHM